VSLHAAGSGGTVPLGWALYLPDDWCTDPERRRRAKIPAGVVFKTKPELGVELAVRAAGWKVPRAPVLGDHAYGKVTELREQLDQAALQYVLSVPPEAKVFAPETIFTVPPARGSARVGRAKPDRDPESIAALTLRLGPSQLRTVTFRDGPDGQPVKSRFAFVRVRAAHEWNTAIGGWVKHAEHPPREEWLIAEWPKGQDAPTDYWLSNLPPLTKPGQLARLARLRWKIELDYRQLKGELGLDHYEGRSWLGWYHHTALVTAAHGFLTLERLNPFHPRPG
jgi:SRSO17 transposase